MASLTSKLGALRQLLLAPSRPEGAIIVVYPPEQELGFRAGYQDLIEELKAAQCPVCVIDLRTTVFDLLAERGLLERAFSLDAAGSRDMHANLSSMVLSEAVALLRKAAQASPDHLLLIRQPAALYPWISYSSLLSEIEGEIRNTIVLPFPGTENGPELRFLDNKDGYNYRAARI